MLRLISIISMTGLLNTMTGTAKIQPVHTDVSLKPFKEISQKAPIRKAGNRHFVRHVDRMRYSGAQASITSAIRLRASSTGVPEQVAIAVVQQESNFKPWALGSAGEIGLMQVKCSTARDMGHRGACAELYRISTNLTYGMRYLRKALKRGSVAYYNAGIYAKKLPARALRYAREVKRKL